VFWGRQSVTWNWSGRDVTWRHPSLSDSCTVGGGGAKNPIRSIKLRSAPACLSKSETLGSD
jgi:hypothetical protein